MDHPVNMQPEELAKGRWRLLSLSEQLGNVGSEVSRALNWRNKGRIDYSLEAVNRALKLLDMTLGAGHSFPRLKEIARVREALVDYFYGSNIYGSSDTLWRKYFDYFAYAARKNC